MKWNLLVLVIYIWSPWALCPAPLTAKDVVADDAHVVRRLRTERTVSLYQRKRRDIFPYSTLDAAK